MDRVDAPTLDGLHRSHRGLRSRQTAEESPHPAGGRRLEDVVADAREREASEHARERIALRVVGLLQHGEWIAARCGDRQGSAASARGGSRYRARAASRRSWR